MKYLFVLLLFTWFYSCTNTAYPIEGRLLKTKVYAGTFISSSYSDNITSVEASLLCVRLKGKISIPDSVQCYIRIEPCRYDIHSDIAWKMCGQYFTWNGTDKEYRVYSNLKLKR